MRRLSAAELLQTWESGLVQPPVQRALTLLAASRPETMADDLATLSIGQRDACLLEFREETFGPVLVCLTRCPSCGERLEITCNASDLRVPTQTTNPAILSFSANDFDVQFRPPNSFDLLAVAHNQDVESGREALWRRCVLSVKRDGEESTVDDLSTEIVEQIIEQMGEADPQADVRVSFTCPSCAHRWHEGFDIVSFLWSEINSWAYRTLRDVHTLASAYGWRESEILALSPARREAYLQMVAQ